MTVYKYKFDFDIGYFEKSPCKNCNRRDEFPQCIDDCTVLDEIHSLLAESVSSCYSSYNP